MEIWAETEVMVRGSFRYQNPNAEGEGRDGRVIGDGDS
jgi:hypothetical protein